MHDPVTLTLHLHGETPLAVEVSRSGATTGATWLPKSMIEITTPVVLGRPATIVLPRALAETRRLL